ncbi:MAG: hypothetical protein WAV66_10080, partial [Anaerolineae bacterium]
MVVAGHGEEAAELGHKRRPRRQVFQRDAPGAARPGKAKAFHRLARECGFALAPAAVNRQQSRPAVAGQRRAQGAQLGR